jgi:hypothetical protein
MCCRYNMALIYLLMEDKDANTDYNHHWKNGLTC